MGTPANAQVAPGAQDLTDLSNAGFSPEDVSKFEQETRQKLANGGFSPAEIDAHFGGHHAAAEEMRGHISKNFAESQPAISNPSPGEAPTDANNAFPDQPGFKPPPTDPGDPNDQPAVKNPTTPPEDPKYQPDAFTNRYPESGPPIKASTGFVGAIETGLKMSTAGLFQQGHAPDTVLPDDAPAYYRIAAGVAQAVGDAPAMYAGTAVLGGAMALMGAIPLTGAAAVAATGAAAMALPAALRSMMMQHYEKGNINNWQDWWERLSTTFVSTAQDAATGAATAGAGAAVGKAMGPMAKPLISTTSKLAAEIATMVTVGNAVKGQVPQSWQEVSDSAATVLIMHGMTAGAEKGVSSAVGKVFKPSDYQQKLMDTLQKHIEANQQYGPHEMFGPEIPTIAENQIPNMVDRVEGKLRDTFVQTGVKPADVAVDALNNPVLRQDLMSDSPEIPKVYQHIIEPDPAKSAQEAEPSALAAAAEGEKPAGQKNTPGYPPPILEPELPKNSPLTEKNDVSGPTPEDNQVKLQEPTALGKFVADEEGSIGIPGLKKPPTLTEAEQRVMDKVATPEVGIRGLWDALSNKFHIGSTVDYAKYLWQNATYENWVDKFSPIQAAVKSLTDGAKLPTWLDPYQLTRLSRDFVGKAQHFIEYGSLDFNTLGVNGKSMKEILEPHKAELEKFTAYLVASRSLELQGRGIESGFDPADAQDIYDKGGRFEKAAGELVDFQNNALKYLKDSGRISVQAYTDMKSANTAYIPFFRMTEDGEALGTKRSKSTSKAIKGIEGSDLGIVDPMESIVKNVGEYIRMAEQNRAVSRFVQLADSAEELGKGKMLERQNMATKIEVSDQEFKAYCKKNNIPVTDATRTAFDVYRAGKPDLQPNQFAAWNEGKLQVFNAPEDLARAFRAMDGNPSTQNAFWKLACLPAKTLRLSIGLTPDFIIRNFFRDQITAGAFSQYNGIPAVPALLAMGDLFSESKHYQDWLKSGGTNGNFTDMHEYIVKDVWNLNKKTGFMDSVWGKISSPLEAIKGVSEMVENSTRLGEFKKIAGGSNDIAKIMAGGMGSREVTVDFQRMGAATQSINMMTAFWNANVQGVDRAARAFAEAPKTTAIRTAAGITLPTVLNWWAHKDDEQYKQAPQWEKDLFWVVPIGADKTALRIPKPFELGILFGSLFERTLDAYYRENPDRFNNFWETMHSNPSAMVPGHDFFDKGFKNYGGTLYNGLVPGFVPNFITAPLEHFANRSSFTGNQIIPPQLQGVSPQFQYTEYTTETAKRIGAVIGKIPFIGSAGPQTAQLQSPMVVENYIRDWAGNLGMYVLHSIDAAMIYGGKATEQATGKNLGWEDPHHADTPIAQMPWIKSFLVQYPSAGAQSIQDFHDGYQPYQEMQNDIKLLKRTGRVKELQQLLTDPDNQELFSKLGGVTEAMSKQSSAIHLIDQADMTGREKRQLIDQIYSGMIETAKAGNQILDQLSKAKRERQRGNQ